MIENKLQSTILKTIAHIFLIIVALACLCPFLIIISASITSEDALVAHGYGLLPKDIDFSAYKMIAQNSKDMINAYLVTIGTTAIGCVGSLLMIIMAAFPLSRMDYKWRTGLNFYFYFTMLFSGGLVSSYIINTQVLGLANNILVLIWPMMFGVYNMFLMRTYFKAIPAAMWEAAEIDGAGKIRKFFSVTLPMISPVFQTILLLAINGTLHIGEYIIVMTNGAPAGKTHTVGSYVISTFLPGFSTGNPNIGYGCAMALCSSVIYGLVALIYMKASKKMQEVY